MKKFFTLFWALTFLLGGLAYAQNYSGLAAKTNRLSAEKTIPNTKGSKAIDPTTTITCSSLWINGITQILEFTMTYHQSDAEYMDGLKMVFPAGMVPNVAGTSDPLTTDIDPDTDVSLNLTITGQTVFWGVDTYSGYGAYRNGTFNFQVSVTNTGLVGNQTINYTVYGDGWGSEPHTATGSVVISKAPEHDLAVIGIVPNVVLSGATITPQVTVQNHGASNETTWSLTLSDGGAYNSTVTNRPINVGDSLQIDMDSWTPSDVINTLTATLTLADDENATNDTLRKTVYVLANTNAFAWNIVYDDTISAIGPGPVNIALTTGVITQIAINSEDFILAADYVGDEIYGILYADESSFPLVKIDPTTGAITYIGGGKPYLVGLAYDVTTETTYVMDYDGVLGTINLATGAVTNIGGNYEDAMGLACDANGNLFAISLNDHIASIDKTTGTSTIIGDLGININYFIDICFDRDNNILYGALYEMSAIIEKEFPFSGGIYVINTTTGAATLITEVFDHLSTLAIPYTSEPQAVSEINTNQVSVYPNPSNGLVNVQVSEKSIITLVDLVGRVIATYQVNGNETIRFNQATGLYILKVESKNQVSTHKLIIQ
jgi:hypothetical protein